MTNMGSQADGSRSGDLERGLEKLHREAAHGDRLAPPGGHEHSNDHLALLYESREEQFEAVVPFVREGLERGERCLYIAAHSARSEVLEALQDGGVDVDAAIESGRLEVLTVDETYMADGTFDLEDSIELLEESLVAAVDEYDGFRVTVEETWLLEVEDAVEDFMTLEARVNDLFQGEDCVALCQYDRRRFPPAILREVIRTHPRLVHDDRVNDNVYYAPPPEYLGDDDLATEVDRKLQTVHERTRTQQAHQRVVEALEAAREGIALLDEAGAFSYVNDAYAETFDYDPAEMIGEHWDDLGIEADPDYVYDEVLPAVEREGQWTGTTTCVRRDGGTFLAKHSLTQTEDGELICVLRDVTERREREKDLELFRSLIDQSNDAVFVIGAETGRILDVNDTACRRLSYPREELLELTVPDIETELPTRADWESFVADLESAGSVNFDGTHRRKDGSTFPVEINVTHVELDRPYVLSIARDVSERYRRERELERALDLLERTERIADVGGWEIDPETLEVFWTDHLFDLLGVDGTGEPVLAEALDMYHEADRPDVEAAVEEALETGEPFDMEARIHTNDGLVRWLRIQGVPETDDDGDVVSLRGAAQDVTERKQREQRLEDLIEQLEESNERLEQFAYAASHDLQEPLRMVSSYLQLIERRYGDALDEDGEEFLEYAVDGADRMREMIDGLLQYSRVETQGDPFEPVDLAAVLADVRSDLQLQIEESDAEITVGDLPTVEGDASQLRQVFQNLLENAIEYSDEDPPCVEVTSDRVSADRASTRSNDGGEWVVSVADEGIGIDSEDAERVFEVFQRLHSREDHQGTGIGLALCERIVERHGGDIWVESEPGEGSTFHFTLPGVTDRPD